ncbi:MAG: serine/threonine-protein kinase, partial [Planctomycetota bacterium]
MLQVSNGDPPVVRVGKPPSQSSNADDDHRGPKPAGRTIGSDPMAETAPGGSAQAVDQHEERSAVKAPAENGSTPGQDLLPPPSKLGGYKIVRMIGRGAMGAVYQAKQISLDRDVALKTIRGRLAQSPTSLARFTREAYAAAQLSHHNVVQIYDFGEEDGQHFFSMEWVRGGSLGDLVREKGTVDPKLAATYILQAARGLQFAHQSGMVHRDIKPANLLLSDDGVVKVADLGLVKVPDDVESDPNEFSGLAESVTSGTQVTLQGTAVGTPAYMAPEQSADATSVDHRADIYSLGCSLFYLLIGHSPFEAESVTEVMKRHAEEPLPDLQKLNPRVPARLSVIVGKAMAKRPERRYESLATMITDLQSYLGIESAVGFSPSTDQADRWEEIARSYSKSQGQKLLAGPAVFGLALLAALAVVLTIVAAASAEDPISVLRWLPFGPVCLMTAVVASITLAASFGGSAV